MKKMISTITTVMVMVGAFAAQNVVAAAQAPHGPRYEPAVDGGWIAVVFADDSTGHQVVDKYAVCFRFVGWSGTQDLYDVWSWGGSDWQAGRGVAVQEGDQVFMRADNVQRYYRHLTSQWEMVQGPGSLERPVEWMGTGHWTEWNSGASVYTKNDFLNVRFDEYPRACGRCVDNKCLEPDLDEALN